MLTELVVFGALLFLKYALYAFMAICVIGVVRGAVKWRAFEDRPRFLRFVAQEMRHALMVRRRLRWTSVLVVISALGFVMGLWPGWMVTVVVALASWAIWGTLAGWMTSRGEKRPVST